MSSQEEEVEGKSGHTAAGDAALHCSFTAGRCGAAFICIGEGKLEFVNLQNTLDTQVVSDCEVEKNARNSGVVTSAVTSEH